MRRPPFFLIFILVIVLLLIVFFVVECPRGERQAPRPARKSLEQVTAEAFAACGLGVEPLQEFKDSKNAFHLKVTLPLAKYLEIEAALEKDIRRIPSVILKKEQERKNDTIFFSWQIDTQDKERLDILFTCRPESSKKESGARPASSAKKAAIIMDDLGYSLDIVRSLIALDRPLTAAVLPYAPYTRETAELARQGGLEVMLHLPLESLERRSPAGGLPAGMIRSGMDALDIKKDVEACLAQVPYCQGVNNHTGSKITEDFSMMHSILEVIKAKKLYFVDSRTSKNSVAFETAVALDIPSAARDVFLDVEPDDGAIKAKIEELFRISQKRGEAVGICHPSQKTLAALKTYLPLADHYGVELVLVSAIVKRPGRPQP
jgi:hypothetical protein